MLKRFRVNNFKSLLNFEFAPLGLNLLVGPNNAGKTNLCSALRFLGLSSLTSLEQAVFNSVGEGWNLTNSHVSGVSEVEFEADCTLAYDDQPLEYSYKLKLSVNTEKVAGQQQIEVAEETLAVTGGPFQHTLLLQNRKGQSRLLHEEGFVQHRSGAPYYVETHAPGDATMLSRLYELKDNPRASLFKRYLRSWLYFNLSPDALRSPEVLREYAFLRHDGANLGRAMFALHNEKPRLEKKVIELLKPLEPKLDLFSYSSPDPEHVYMFLEDEKGRRFGMRSMSDGTLRFLAMAYLLVMLEETAVDGGLRPLIVIEEPENGLYVGHLKPMLQRIDPSGSKGQFIFTSHSPYFVDLFDSCIEGIHVIKPGIPSSVLSKPDPAKLSKLVEEMPLGELHFRELLG